MPPKRVLVTQDDIDEIDELDSGTITLPTGQRRTVTQADFFKALKSDTAKVAYIGTMFNKGVDMDKLAEVQREGLDAVKYDRNGNEIGADYATRLLYLKETKADLGLLEHTLDNDTIAGEQIIDLDNMDDDDIEAIIKREGSKINPN